MAIDLRELIAPSHTALVTQECQLGVVGPGSALPELAAQAADVLLPHVAWLVDAARDAGAEVVHCLAARRRDGKGANTNGRLFRYMERAPVQLTPGTPAVELVPEISRADSDIVLTRLHGLSPFQGTELDSILRNLGIRTIVAVGVSVNVAIQNLTFDAVNASYQVVIPRDAVAGWPADYVEAVFENTLGGISTLVRTADVVDAWS